MAEDFDKTFRFGKVTLRLEGFTELFRKLNRLGGDVQGTAVDVFNAGAERVFQKSQPLVPVEHRHLKQSGRVSRARVNKRTGKVSAAVLYGGPQLDRLTGKTQDLRAIMVHERLDLKHPRGGQAKYLETPYLAEKARIMDDLRARIAQTVERRG